MKKIVISLAVFLGTGIFGYARTYYVRPDGNDTNSGLANTPTEAWKTISQAVKNLKPGDVVEVQEGTYQGGIVVDVRGEEKQPITLRATGNVVINTTNEGYNKYCLSIRGCYIHLEGFDLSGGNYWGGSVFLWAGSHHNVIRNNTIHHSSTGVGLWQSDENLIVQNKFYNNSGNAIFIYHSSDPGYSDNNIIARNLFYDNGVAIRVARAKGTKIVGNIIYGSSSSGIYLSGEECGNAKYLTTETLIEHNIVANIPRNKNAVGIYQAEVVTKTELKCNDVWGNEKRNYSGLDPGGTDISEDPMFVAPEEKRFDLKEESPCFKKGIYPPPAVSKNTAEKEKWGLLAEYLDEEFQIKGVCLTPAIGKEGIDLTVRINVSSRQDVARALLKMEIVRGGSQFSPAPRDVSLKKGDNTLEVTLSLPETPGPGSSVKVCFLNREGKEMMTGIFPIIGADCLRIRMEKPSYRNTLFTSQTDKDVVVRVAIDGKEENLKNKKLNFLIRDSTGKEKFLLLEKEPVQGKRYTFSGGTFPPGKYAIVAHLVSGARNLDSREIPLRIVEPIPGYTFIDENGNLLVDGKPFYPIGMYNGYAPDYKYLKEAGFNSVTCDISHQFKNTPALKKSFDEAASFGFKINATCMIGNFLEKSKPGYLSRIEDMTALVREIKTHPAIFTWLINEEMGYSQAQEELYKALLEEDPYHPISCNGELGTGFTSLYNIADIFQRHSYSYPLYKNSETENYNRLEGRLAWIRNIVQLCQLSEIPSAPGEALADHKKPFFFWPQYFWGGYWAHGDVGRFLTYKEMRYLVWGAFMEGAGGIYFWAYWHDYTNPRMNPSLWEGVRAIASEMASLEPVLTAPEAEGITVAPVPEKNFHWRAKQSGKDIFLFAAWSGEEPLTITVTLPAKIGTSQVWSWSEERAIPVVGGKFQDTLKRGEVVIYTTARERKKSKAPELLKDPFFAETPSYQSIPGNLAYGRPARLPDGKATQIGATSRSNKNYTWFNHAYFAIDGDPHTCWFPLYDGNLNPSWNNPCGKDSPWLEVTLPEKKAISRIVVKSYLPRHWDDPACNLQDYDLQYADETGNWQTIVEVRDNRKEIVAHTFPPVVTQKIRLVAHKGLFLSELEVYPQ